MDIVCVFPDGVALQVSRNENIVYLNLSGCLLKRTNVFMIVLDELEQVSECPVGDITVPDSSPLSRRLFHGPLCCCFLFKRLEIEED